MKKKIYIVSVVFIVSILFFACTPQKQVANNGYNQTSQQQSTKQETDIQRQIRETKEQAELLKAQHELELLRIQQEQAVAALNEKATLEAGIKKLLIPCMKEALELEKTYQMAAQGISTEKVRQELALTDANRKAVAELMTRWVGVIKNGIEDYTKDSDTKSLTRLQEAQLEGLCINACEKAINKLMKPACREFVTDKDGNYGCYVAVYVSTNDVLDEIDKAIEEEKELDIDKPLMRKRLQAELNEQSRKEQEVRQAELERLKALQEKSEE